MSANDPVRQHIDRVKSMLDLKDYARDFLGIEVDGNDKAVCLFHIGEKMPSMHFYPTNYHCFSCEEHGDFISLHQAVHPDHGFMEIIDDASGFVGIGSCPRESWTDTEVSAYRKDIRDRRRIEQIYMASADYFVECAKGSDVAQYLLKEKWGLDPEFCNRKKIGYCPEGKTDLLVFLRGQGFSTDEIVSSGVVTSYQGDGQTNYSSAFRGRIVFPYWVGAKIVYFIGRQTSKTPSLPDREPPKYKKLKVHKDGGNISKHVKNCLYGMDFLYDKRYTEIIITEGIADAMKAEQHGIAVISPVTTRLKRQDFIDCMDLLKSKTKIFIINDNEESRAGEHGAMDIAHMLEEVGCSVRIGTIPRPEGLSKIDLADLMRQSEDPVGAVDKVKAEADIPLVHVIKKIDPGSDEIERNQQILALQEMWCRLHAAQVPAAISIIREHFGMRVKQANAIESSVNKLRKESEKKAKRDTARQAAASQQVTANQLPLKQRIAFEIESEGQTPAVGMRIFEWIRDWLIDNGAKFYKIKTESRGIMFFRKRLYDISSVDYQVIMDDVAGLNYHVPVHKVAFTYLKNYVLREGSRIDDLSWITTLDNGVKYLAITHQDDDKLIMLDPSKQGVESVPNGDNEHNIILKAPRYMEKFEYDPDVSIEEGMRLYENLIFGNMTCDIQDRYFITCWNFLTLFVDNLGTRPILLFGGDAGSGKTTTSKLLSVLLYGKERQEYNSTLAATYDSSSCTPCIYWDNKEQKDLKEEEIQFLIASATGASRQKKSGLGTGEIVQQTPQCMILSTSIEMFSKEELIQRTLIINFSEKHHKDGFTEELCKDSIRKYRNKILSSMLNIAFKVHCELQDLEYRDQIEQRIRRDFPDNAKARNMSAFVCMWAVLKEVCKYIRHNYIVKDEYGDDVSIDFNFGSDFEHIHHKVLGTWIFGQTQSHKDVVSGGNRVVQLLDSLYKAWTILELDEDSPEWSRERGRRFLEQYHVSFSSNEGFDYLLCGWTDLHYAFSQVSNNSIRYDIDSSKNLALRIRNIRNILHENGWDVAINVRKIRGARQSILLPEATQDKIDIINKKYDGNVNWLFKGGLRLVG
jgi:hypothetical protein